MALCAVLMWRCERARRPPSIRCRPRRATAAARGACRGAASALAHVGELLLDGGYLSNDVTPPSIFLDDLPNWEFGVIEQSRDLAQALRRDFSRSLTQSIEDKDLAEAQPLFSTTNDRWLLPSTESQYRAAIARVDAYRVRLGDGNLNDAQFYARADNLASYLATVEGRLRQPVATPVRRGRTDPPGHRPRQRPTQRQSKPAEAARKAYARPGARSTTCSTRRAAPASR